MKRQQPRYQAVIRQCIKLLGVGITILCCELARGTPPGRPSGAVGQQSEQASSQWPQWRGPQATGASSTAQPPLTWSETENVRWKTLLPGKGHSTPIVWDDSVIVTLAKPIGKSFEPRYSQAPGAHDNLPVTHRQAFHVLCLDRSTGKVRWDFKAQEEEPHDAGHFTASLASASPCTDGQRIIASFGSYGVYCLNFAGELIWQQQLGKMQSKHGHGEGSSPLLHQDTVILNWDHEGDSFIVALDARSGQQRWRRARDEVTSWSTPIAVDVGNQTQVIVPGTGRVRAYDLANGEVVWECGGLSANIVASPVAANGLVVVGSSYEKRAMLAIRLSEARGDVTDTPHVVWQRDLRTPYVPSPLLYRQAVYFLRHYQGILTRVDLGTGREPTGPFRLGNLRDLYASPVAADGRVYFTDRAGNTMVLSATEIPRPLAVNPIGESVSASLALAGRQLFIRGEKHLFCLEENSDPSLRSVPGTQ